MTVLPRRRAAIIAAGAGALCLLTAACAKSASTSTTPPGTGPTGTGSAATAPAPKGPPIKVMIAATLDGPTELPELPWGAEAAADRINAQGGIDGRPVQVIVCDDNAPSPDACARKAVSDHVAAVVGSQSGGINPILLANGIPQVGNYPFGVDDYIAPNSFPLSAGTANAGAAAKLLARLGVKTIVPLAISGAGAATDAVTFLKATAAHIPGMTILPTIGVPFPSTDLSPQVAKAMSTNAQAIVLIAFPTQTLQMVQAARAAGDQQKIVLFSAVFPQALVDQLKSAANGIYIISSFLPVSDQAPAMRQFRTDMARYASGQELSDLSLNSWAAMQLFDIAAKKATAITAAGILKVLPTLKNINLGITAPFSLGIRGVLPNAPRIVNLQTFYAQVKNGVITALTQTPQPSYP